MSRTPPHGVRPPDTSAPDTSAPDTTDSVRCPFCSKPFAPEQARNACGPCGGCGFLGALKPTCALTCPHCGYAVFPEKPLRSKAELGEGEGGEEKGGGAGNNSAGGGLGPLSMPLTQCPLGQSVRVTALEADENGLRKLLTLGLLPGVELELERRQPGFVCRVGRARLAVDWELASCVQVRVLR